MCSVKISRNRSLVSDSALACFLRNFEQMTDIVDGSIRYSSFGFREFFEILPDAFVVKPEISRSESIKLFSKALRECRHAGKMNGDHLIERAEAIHRSSLAVPQVKFALWTKFRATNMSFHPGFRLRWHGVEVRSAARLPKHLRHSDYFFDGFGRIYPDEPQGFGHIIMYCAERNEARAVERMMDTLQLVTGLINLYEVWQGRTLWAGRNWTDGRLWLGPTQFVFREKEFLSDKNILYNTDYDEEAWRQNPLPMERVLKVIPIVRRALSALNDHPLNDMLSRSVMLLQDGFVAHDSNHRLLRYWSALEQIYVESNDKMRSNEKVLDRAIFAEAEPDICRWKLSHIARLRNNYVHAGGSSDDLNYMSQFLREMLARHINHWIFKGNNLKNHREMLDLVSMSSDRDVLLDKRKLINKRLKYIDDISRDFEAD